MCKLEGFLTTSAQTARSIFIYGSHKNHQSVEYASACISDHAIYHENNARVTTLLHSGGDNEKHADLWRPLACVCSSGGKQKRERTLIITLSISNICPK